MTHSEKEKLTMIFERWAESSHLSDSPLNMLVWLDLMKLIPQDGVDKLLKTKGGHKNEK